MKDDKPSDDLSGEVRITGIINDEEFSAKGFASGNPSTGKYDVQLDYENIPKGWHPFMYADVKVSLLFLREERNGKNFLTLCGGRSAGTKYKSAGTIDLGDGNILRNNTNIQLTENNKFVAVYVMHGTAHIGELTGLEYFEETMLPMGPGRIAALAIARWKSRTGEALDAIFSTRYMFDTTRSSNISRPQVRRIEANPHLEGNSFRCSYDGFVWALPKVVDEAGPYIGHLIS